MNTINFLPWREQERNVRDKKILSFSVLFWLLCALAAFLLYQSITGKLSVQQQRNTELDVEITQLNSEIQQIEALRLQKHELVGRIEIVQQLQHNRLQVVRVLDDLVRKLPEGVTLDSLKKQNLQLELDGRAQSNARVSELMNRLDSSEWFGQSELSVVNAQDENNNNISQFELTVTDKVKEVKVVEGIDGE